MKYIVRVPTEIEDAYQEIVTEKEKTFYRVIVSTAKFNSRAFEYDIEAIESDSDVLIVTFGRKYKKKVETTID